MNHDCIDACQHGITDAGEVITDYETNEEFWARLDKLDERRNLAIKYVLYVIRWQITTPLLAIVLADLPAAILANLIGGLAFFWVDKLIFEKEN